MTQIRAMAFLVVFLAVSVVAVGQDAGKNPPGQPVTGTGFQNAGLEKELWKVDQQWLCSAGATPYYKNYKECIDFRNTSWAGKFFEISYKGQVQTKAQMIAAQRAAPGTPGVGPYPDDFHLMAVYGNVALATDHTTLKSMGPDGKLLGVDLRVLRVFVNENGKWRPAGAALVPIAGNFPSR